MLHFINTQNIVWEGNFSDKLILKNLFFYEILVLF